MQFFAGINQKYTGQILLKNMPHIIDTYTKLVMVAPMNKKKKANSRIIIKNYIGEISCYQFMYDIIKHYINDRNKKNNKDDPNKI